MKKDLGSPEYCELRETGEGRKPCVRGSGEWKEMEADEQRDAGKNPDVSGLSPRYSLTSPSDIKKIMETRGFSFSKSLGQNFLIDRHAVDRIIDAVVYAGSENASDCRGLSAAASSSARVLDPDVLVIEIGPGFGVLTQRLCMIANRVIAIEKDKTLPPILKDFIPSERLEIICEDVLKCSLDRIISDAGYERAIVVANLPYYITTPIVMKVLEEEKKVEALVVMMQKEVADRILDRGDRGAITMATAYYAKSSRVADIGRNSFMPAPKVDSAVLRMTRIPPKLDPDEEKTFKQVIGAIYRSRRKTLLNSLNSLNLCDKNELKDVIMKVGYPPEVRGETLSIEDLLVLSRVITTLEER